MEILLKKKWRIYFNKHGFHSIQHIFETYPTVYSTIEL